MAKTESTEIARIVEEVRTTLGGGVCTLMLILNAVCTIPPFIFDSSAVRQAAWAAAFTGGSVLWGIGVIVGRRRTYVVHRSPKEGGVPGSS